MTTTRKLAKKIVRIGLDIAKNVFQAHGVDEREQPALRKRLKRAEMLKYFAQLPACEVGMEACGGAHYWARELTKLGHTVKIMAPHYVKPYRTSRNKNDVNDAEAICEAMTRPKTRFIEGKSEEQQAVLMVHKARQLVVKARTALVNQIRGYLGEYGIVAPKGPRKLRGALPGILEDADNSLPDLARQTLASLLEQFRHLDAQVEGYDQQISAIAQTSEPAQRLMQLNGVGPLGATALVASIGSGKVYDSARNYAASVGLTPKQHTSGDTVRLGHITRQGDTYIRTLLVHGARSYLAHLDKKQDRTSAWARALIERRNKNVAAVAYAAKLARIAWAMLSHGTEYRPSAPEVVAA